MSAALEPWMRRARILQNEDDWRSCELPHQIFRLFSKDSISERKALLLTCACLRRQWHWPDVEQCRWVVETLERKADRLVSTEETRAAATALREARLQATSVMGGMWWQASSDYTDRHLADACVTAWSTAEAMGIAAGRQVRVVAGLPDDRPEDAHRASEECAQCDLLRCIFGNPFQPVTLDAACLTRTVVSLAEAASDERSLPAGTLDNDRLAVLADALEDAGCTDPAIIDHLRGPGPHVRGCHVVDMLLGKS